MRLTSLQIDKLPIPEKGQRTYWEDGFGVRVSQGGSKSFVVMYGQQRKLKTIGRYPAMSLKMARRQAFDILADAETEIASVTLKKAISLYQEHIERTLRPSTVASYNHYLKPLMSHTWDSVSEQTVPDKTHYKMTAKVFFNWCIRNGHTDRNPFQYYKATYGQRDRVLSDEELRAVWAYNYPPFSDYLKLFLLTGLRKGESVHIEHDDALLWIDGAYTKNKHRHELPLTPSVRSLLPLPYFNGWGKGMDRMRRETGTGGFTIHDLRRTFATRHAMLGTPIHVVEALLNHRSGTINPIAKIYIRYKFLDEARAAQLAYEHRIQELLSWENGSP